MSNSGVDNPTPQFGTAEYIGTSANDHCHYCQQPITGTYYRLNGAMTCRNCAEKVYSAIPTFSHADYVRGLLYGVGAAVAGMILYAVFEIATGLIIGYVSLAVGWMVGKAMMKGSNNQGGRRYQITAALLTYAAVSMAAIPIWIHYQGQHQNKDQITQQQKLAEEQRELEKESGREPHTAPAKPAVNPARALLMLGLLGLASPFLELSDPIHGLIGLFILSIGLRIAWQLTGQRAPAIDGPFQSAGG